MHRSVVGTIFSLIPVMIAATATAEAEPAKQFSAAVLLPWQTTFVMDSNDWRQRWHLDGRHATVETAGDGFTFTAGPQPGRDAHHAVLWTRARFTGDVRVSYDYTRLDDADHSVNLLYLQATGTNRGPYLKDILDWADQRNVPKTSIYFQHMNLLAISYAAYGPPQAKDTEHTDYVRARRYPVTPWGNFQRDTQIKPTQGDTGLFKQGVKHRIDVIKRGGNLLMKVTPEGGEPRVFAWDTTNFPPVTEGRVGLRHMAGRSARYENFTVYELPEPERVDMAWHDLETAEDVCRVFAKRMDNLLAALDLDHPGLERVKAAVGRGDRVAACQALVAYYREGDSGSWLRTHKAPDPSNETVAWADHLLAERNVLVNDDTPMPRLSDGGRDWYFQPQLGGRQFTSQQQRLQYLNRLRDAWLETGNPVYIEKVNDYLLDWTVHMPVPEGLFRWHPVWTGINVGLRHGRTFTPTFYALQQHDAFTPATRLLMLASLHEAVENQALPQVPHFLHSNHSTMHLMGLANVATAFPEFERADAWRDFTIEMTTKSLDAQFYPSHVQAEMSAGYHWVAMRNLLGIIEALEGSDHDAPEALRGRMEGMYQYMADVIRPNGALPTNNDSPGDAVDYSTRLLEGARRFNRPDWVYSATNGEQGEPPALPASRYRPWAGQLISRGGWDRDAHWSFFDIGPHGIGHQHNDALHLSVYAHGRTILSDNGKFAYDGSNADLYRESYAFHSRGHNVILVDGYGQNALDRWAKQPHHLASIRPGFDFAVQTYDRGFSKQPLLGAVVNQGNKDRIDAILAKTDIPGSHTRAVVYLRGKGWLVVDRVEAKGEHTIQPLWHFHEDCGVKVETDGISVRSTDPDAGNVRIVPLGGMGWSVELIKGQMDPHPQGWYSQGANQIEPAYCAAYTAKINDQATFAWLIVPGKGDPPAVRIKALEAPNSAVRYRLAFPGGEPIEVAASLDGKGRTPLEDGYEFRGYAAVRVGDAHPQAAIGEVVDHSGDTVDQDLPQKRALLDARLGRPVASAHIEAGHSSSPLASPTAKHRSKP